MRTRPAIISKVTKYYSRAFFLAGLMDEVLAQVTIEGTEDFDEVVMHAQSNFVPDKAFAEVN